MVQSQTPELLQAFSMGGKEWSMTSSCPLSSHSARAKSLVGSVHANEGRLTNNSNSNSNSNSNTLLSVLISCRNLTMRILRVRILETSISPYKY